MKKALQHPIVLPLGIFIFSCLVFLIGLSTQEIIGFDSRFYLFDLEMWRNGLSWFPTTYGRPYPDYPVTSTAITVFFGHILGALNKTVAILPSALAAAFTVLMTYFIGALHSKRYGVYAVLFLFLTYTFIKEARSISLDMYTTCITAICFYLIYSADLLDKKLRLLWLFPLLVIGFAFRGPIGLVLPTGLICFYYFFNRQKLFSIAMGFIALFLLAVCTGSLILIAYHVEGLTFVKAVLERQVLGRLNHDYLPFYYYFTHSFLGFALSFPIAVLTAMGALFLNNQTSTAKERRLLFNLILWMLVIMVGMSIPSDKKLRYILPMLPAVALLAAYPLTTFQMNRWLSGVKRFTLAILICFPTICLLALEILYFYLWGHEAVNTIYFKPLFSVFIGLQLINFFVLQQNKLNPDDYPLYVLTITTLSFLIIYFAVAEPMRLHMEKGGAFIQSIEKLRTESNANLIFYKMDPDGFPIKYLIYAPPATQPTFVNDEVALFQTMQTGYVVAKTASFATLNANLQQQVKIIGYDKVGHVSLVVFSHR